jgi:hypothetical protein
MHSISTIKHISKYTSHQVPTSTRFGTKVPSSVYQQRRIVKSNTYFSRWTPSLASHKLKVLKCCNCRSRIISTGTAPVAPHCCNSSATQRRASSVSRPQPFIVHSTPDTGCVAASVGVHSDITHRFTYFYVHAYSLSEH